MGGGGILVQAQNFGKNKKCNKNKGVGENDQSNGHTKKFG